MRLMNIDVEGSSTALWDGLRCLSCWGSWWFSGLSCLCGLVCLRWVGLNRLWIEWVVDELVCLIRWVQRCIDETWASTFEVGRVATIVTGPWVSVLVHIGLNHGLHKRLDVKVALGGGGFDLAKFIHMAYTATLVALSTRTNGVMIVA